ncbi:sensor of ECF-type sigma factor [Aquimarina sp. MMG016]|uniref:sensor of ECF-type sigma factor n=1 Tax=Aquimarina sp. MMG016 TaxID=2822690 RepID=UPI001B3A6966|nr:sensor of ECF-type sigma factor [Aquimarina sp. MMG016]MBQ4821809.1 sensor of ECF-type sigma factor [Aquimarina sp. MMG016]
MKNILLLICITFTLQIYAQKGQREKVKAFKVAYITEQLDLSSKEAQQFWPIYNEHQETVENLKKEERKLIRSLKDANNGPDGLSDKQAGDFLDNYLDAEDKKAQSRKKLIIDLQKVLSNKKILKLIKAETDFNKRLMQQLRERRMRKY